MSKLWTAADEKILGSLKSHILSGPMLLHPDLLHHFYLNKYFSKDIIEA